MDSLERGVWDAKDLDIGRGIAMRQPPGWSVISVIEDLDNNHVSHEVQFAFGFERT